ncbi:MAG TPA: MFS transporter [Anaerolineae bacterium]|nr:MFS transporter [Anaerolineae bacterium]
MNVTASNTPRTQAKLGLILLAFIAFISLGLPDGLLGVAWPSIRANFKLPLDSLGLLLVALTAGYLTSSFLSGRIMARLGVGGLLAASCALTGAGLIGYTLAPAWWIMVALGVVAGLGAGAIDAGLNTYIAANHGEGLMQWLHASFGVGITLGPIIMTTGLNLFGEWRVGYVVVGTAQLTLAACFALTASRWKRAPTAEHEVQRLTDYKTPLRETLRQPTVWLSMALFFIYVGIELGLGHWGYTLLTESRHITPQVAGIVAGSYWGTFTLGRILAGLYARRLGVHTLVRLSLLGALLGAGLVWWNPSDTISLIGVAVVGFAIAPIFPGLVSGTRDRVGAHHAANTIGIQIGAAGLGGALLPGLAGILARQISLEVIPIYLAILIATLLTLYWASIKYHAN